MNTVKMLFARYTSSLTISYQVLVSFCLVCSRSLFVWPFFFWPLYCNTFYALRLLITTLVSSNFHCNNTFPVNRCFFFNENSSSLPKIINTMYVYRRVSLCIIFHYFSFNVVFIELNHDPMELFNRMGGVLIIVLASNVVDAWVRGPCRSNQAICMCFFFAEHATLRSKNKD